MDYLSASDLTGYLFYILISLVLKKALELGRKRLSETSISFDLKEVEDRLHSDKTNVPQINNAAEGNDIFNPFSTPPLENSDVWSVSRMFYMHQIESKDNQSFRIRLLRTLLKYYPVFEKYIPYILLTSVCYILLFVNRGFFVLAEFFIFFLFLISLLISIVNISLISSSRNHIKEIVSLSVSEEQKINKALLLIHSTIFFRSIGIFWKMTDVVKWLFKNN